MTLLIDFGYHPRPYSYTKEQITPEVVRRKLVSSHWADQGHDVWTAGDTRLTFTALGFAILENGDVNQAYNVIGSDVNVWRKTDPAPQYPRILPVEDDDWRGEAACLIARATLERYREWAARPLYGGLAVDAERLLDRMRRVSMTYPPDDPDEYRKLERQAVGECEILVHSSRSEGRFHLLPRIVDIIADLMLPIGTFLLGISTIVGDAWFIAGCILLALSIILHLMSLGDLLNDRDDTWTPPVAVGDMKES